MMPMLRRQEAHFMSAADEAKCRKDYGRLRKLYLERRRTCG